MTFFTRSMSLLFALPICVLSTSACAQDSGQSIKLQSPIECTLDVDCFIQQFTDMDASPDSVDPFCGTATYNGHKGTDIRLRTLADIKNNVEVLAAADGTVKGVRKNMPDRLVQTNADRDALNGVECGNGVVIDHGDNIETQYCHLKQYSPSVHVGDTVKAGQKLGYVGASGLAQFPHLHISLRKDGRILDPFTGKFQSQDCTGQTDKTWWTDRTILSAKRDAILLDANITGAPIKHNTLVQAPPSKAVLDDATTVGWVWYSNLQAKDQVYIKLTGPNGFKAETLSEPLNRNKASWSGFVGKKRQPQSGAYSLTTYVLRGGDGKLSYSQKTFVVEK